MAAPRGTHRGAGGEGHGPGVEQLRASQIHVAIGTAGDEHPAVIEQRGREALARHGHLADGENGAGGRIEHFGRVQHDVAVRAAHDQHAPAAELAGRMALARRGHRAVHQREGVALGIENFKRRRGHAGGLAAGNQKAVIGERGDGGAAARFAHGQDRGPGIGGGIVELGCVGGGLARDAAAGDQHLPAGERRANVLATRHAHGGYRGGIAGDAQKFGGFQCVTAQADAASGEHPPVGEDRGASARAGFAQIAVLYPLAGDAGLNLLTHEEHGNRDGGQQQQRRDA